MRAMPFPKKLLNSYEDMVVDLHPHWLFLWRQVAAFVAGIILFLVWATARLHGWKNTGLLWLSLVVLLVSALWLLRRYLIWRTTNFCITTDRLIFRHGVVAMGGSVASVSLTDVEHGTLFRAEIVLAHAGLEAHLASRPSDALALAVRSPEALILVAPHVLPPSDGLPDPAPFPDR